MSFASGAMIRLVGVHKSFGQLDVLRGVDLEVTKKEVVVVIGPSGSGKSTMLRCMNGLEPSKG
jgi:polar amino acid transport system ATP-binding protein